jgi:hypothetical protein
MSHRRSRRTSSHEARSEARSEPRAESRSESRTQSKSYELSTGRSARTGRSRRATSTASGGRLSVTSRPSQKWSQLYGSDSPAQCADLNRLIELDAPLQHNSGLVLMYGPFQTEMSASHGLGVASWLRECLRKHGEPSLLRYDYHRRAQVLRRDQFQGLLSKLG